MNALVTSVVIGCCPLSQSQLMEAEKCQIFKTFYVTFYVIIFVVKSISF